MKGKVYDFSKGFALFITNKDVTEKDIKGDENKTKQFLRILVINKEKILKVIDQSL